MNALDSLNFQIRRLLADMEILSEAKTAVMDASPGKDKPGSKLLTHNGPSLFLEWQAKFANTYTEAQQLDWPTMKLEETLQRLLDAGKAAHALRKHGPPKIHDSTESADFILSNYEGVDCRTVAAIESERGAFCAPEYVLWLRRRNSLNDLGYPAQASDRRLQLVVKLMTEEGSQTKVAKAMGVSQQTVSRLLGQAKQAA